MSNDPQENKDFEEEIIQEEPVTDVEFDDTEGISVEFDDTEGISKDKIKQLKEEIKDLKEKARENLDGWQRERAEFTNYKKEEDARRVRMREILEEAVTTEFLTTLDNFDMAMMNKEVWESVDQNWRIGIEHIYNQFRKTLEGYGMKEIGVQVGDSFDPEKHQALSQTDTNDKSQDDTVAKVIQKGYEMKGGILRPAKVEVYKLQESN